MKSFDLRALALAAVVLGGILSSVSAQQIKSAFVDPLDLVADQLPEQQVKSTMAVSRAGKRLVAVGMHGQIIISDDQGAHWQQVQTPVQSDLTAVFFATDKVGWAVGHDGVILHSEDAGSSWQRQFDGRMAAESFKAFYQQRIDAGEADLAVWLGEIERNYGQGPSLPYLDVLFDDLDHGYAIGSFGSIAITKDGGKSWQPGSEQIDNPRLLNLNAIRKVGNDLYIAAEQGVVFRLNRTSQQFEPLETGYAGSFFGINGQGDKLLAYGLRGALYASCDGGQHWQVVKLPERAALTGSTVLPDGRIVLASVAGRLWISSLDWAGFEAKMPPRPTLLTGLVSLDDGRVAVSGLAGMQLNDFGSASDAQDKPSAIAPGECTRGLKCL
ncbi:WD40/YVTN/BNR-like repeat-containing protein [Pseudomonas sp. LB3P14]